MYVEPWIFWLILAPLAAVAALYIGYVALLLLGFVSITIGIGFAIATEWLTTKATSLTTSAAHALTCSLRLLVTPFKQHGPWLDYAVVAGVAFVVSLGTLLWLAA